MRYRWLVPVGLLCAAVYLWSVASTFREAVGRYELIGPGFFPKILLVAIVVVSLLALVREFVARKRSAPAPEKTTFYPGDLAAAVAITVAYVAGLHAVGFVLATLAFQVLLLVVVFRIQRWQVVCGVPAILTSVFFVIFIGLMSVPLPRGTGVFHQLNSLMY